MNRHIDIIPHVCCELCCEAIGYSIVCPSCGRTRDVRFTEDLTTDSFYDYIFDSIDPVIACSGCNTRYRLLNRDELKRAGELWDDDLWEWDTYLPYPGPLDCDED